MEQKYIVPVDSPKTLRMGMNIQGATWEYIGIRIHVLPLAPLFHLTIMLDMYLPYCNVSHH